MYYAHSIINGVLVNKGDLQKRPTRHERCLRMNRLACVLQVIVQIELSTDFKSTCQIIKFEFKCQATIQMSGKLADN